MPIVVFNHKATAEDKVHFVQNAPCVVILEEVILLKNTRGQKFTGNLLTLFPDSVGKENEGLCVG